MKTSIHPVPQPPLPAEPHMCWAGPVAPETKTWKQTWKEVSGSSDSRFKTVHRNLVTSGQWLNTGQLTDEPLPSAPLSLILSALPQKFHEKMPNSNSVKSHRASFKARLIMHRGSSVAPGFPGRLLQWSLALFKRIFLKLCARCSPNWSFYLFSYFKSRKDAPSLGSWGRGGSFAAGERWTALDTSLALSTTSLRHALNIFFQMLF